MKISIIIPALNEEKTLPTLLESIKDQTFTDYEVIVAISPKNTDSTEKISNEFGAKVIQGGLVAEGRNNGAKVAKGEYLYFFDADVKLPKDFLEKTVEEMEERNLAIATTEYRPIENIRLDKLYYRIVTLGIKILQFGRNPIAVGFCTLVKKDIYNKTSGFDNEIKIGEDFHFSKECARYGKFRILNNSYILVGNRRLKKEGRLGLLIKYLRAGIVIAIKGKVTQDSKIDYEFADYDDVKDKKLDELLIKMEQRYDNFVNKFTKNDEVTKSGEEELIELEKSIEKAFGILFRVFSKKSKR